MQSLDSFYGNRCKKLLSEPLLIVVIIFVFVVIQNSLSPADSNLIANNPEILNVSIFCRFLSIDSCFKKMKSISYYRFT